MKTQTLNELFIEELENIYSSEKQLLEVLPRWKAQASFPELKNEMTNLYQETENQVDRLENIFTQLDLTPTEKMCEATQGLVAEGNEIIEDQPRSSVIDAAIINVLQKTAHYAIAAYGTLRSYAKHLDLDDEVVSLLKETLDEKGKADKKLSKIADGSFFSTGVNEEAALKRDSRKEI